MSELSNAVSVLIARMESHPEDFDMSAIDRPKFGHLAPYLTKLAGGGDELAIKHEGSYVEEAFWFLNETDKQALADAWKQYHYKTFEKRTMELVFDDDYYKRQEEQNAQMRAYKQQMYQNQNAVLQGSALQGASNYTPLHNNPNQGLLSAAGSAFAGIFK